MRRVIPFLPALLVGLAAIAMFNGPSQRRSLAVVETPAARLTLAAGEHLDFDLALRVLRPTPRVGPCPTLFLHLLDSEGGVVRQFDHKVSVWPAPNEEPGRRVVDRSTLFQSVLEEPLPPGSYQLATGLWEPDSRRRFRLNREGSRPVGRLTVAEVEITGSESTAPSPKFEGWSALEPTESVHGRARRGWTRAATIDIGESPATLEWRLVLDLPPWATPRDGHGLVVECTGETLSLVERWQEIRIRLPAGEPCRLSFPPIDSTGDTGGLLYSLTWSKVFDEAAESSCVRSL